jgi:hypothetical protein
MTTIPSDLILQSEVTALLGVPDGVLVGLRKRNAPLYCVKLDHQEQFRYSREEIETVRAALLTLGRFGLSIHGAGPLGFQRRHSWPTADEEYIAKEAAIEALGVSARIVAGWAAKGIGPHAMRAHLRQAFRYRGSHVEAIREALLVLGSFGIGLPGVPPLEHR